MSEPIDRSAQDSQPSEVDTSDNSVVDNNNNSQNAIVGSPRRVSEGNHRAVDCQPNAVNNSGHSDVNNNRTSENANQAIPMDVLLRNPYWGLLKSVEVEEKKPKKRPRCPDVGSHVVDHYFEKISCRASFDASRYTREPSYGPSDDEMGYTVDTEESETLDMPKRKRARKAKPKKNAANKIVSEHSLPLMDKPSTSAASATVADSEKKAANENVAQQSFPRMDKPSTSAAAATAADSEMLDSPPHLKRIESPYPLSEFPNYGDVSPLNSEEVRLLQMWEEELKGTRSSPVLETEELKGTRHSPVLETSNDEPTENEIVKPLSPVPIVSSESETTENEENAENGDEHEESSEDEGWILVRHLYYGQPGYW